MEFLDNMFIPRDYKGRWDSDIGIKSQKTFCICRAFVAEACKPFYCGTFRVQTVMKWRRRRERAVGAKFNKF
jgi:hypothetical protein